MWILFRQYVWLTSESINRALNGKCDLVTTVESILTLFFPLKCSEQPVLARAEMSKSWHAAREKEISVHLLTALLSTAMWSTLCPLWYKYIGQATYAIARLGKGEWANSEFKEKQQEGAHKIAKYSIKFKMTQTTVAIAFLVVLFTFISFFLNFFRTKHVLPFCSLSISRLPILVLASPHLIMMACLPFKFLLILLVSFLP